MEHSLIKNLTINHLEYVHLKDERLHLHKNYRELRQNISMQIVKMKHTYNFVHVGNMLFSNIAPNLVVEVNNVVSAI